MITSPQNERVKRARLLLDSGRARRESGQAVLEGARLIADALRAGVGVAYVLYDPGQISVDTLGIAPQTAIAVSPKVLLGITRTESPQGAIAVVDLPTFDEARAAAASRLLILDGLRDPGNVGTILRSAAAAGCDAVLIAPGTVDPYNDKALRAGMGAHFRVPLGVCDWSAIARMCAGRAVYLAAMAGEQTYDSVDWRSPHALIIGGEADGASADGLALATLHIRIPMAAQTESLNAAAAAAVLLFEAARQRG